MSLGLGGLSDPGAQVMAELRAIRIGRPILSDLPQHTHQAASRHPAVGLCAVDQVLEPSHPLVLCMREGVAGIPVEIGSGEALSVRDIDLCALLGLRLALPLPIALGLMSGALLWIAQVDV